MIKIDIENFGKEVDSAIDTIEKLERINSFNFNLTLSFNSSLKDYQGPLLGEYTQGSKCIKINPKQCYKEDHYEGYIDNISIKDIIIHEFSHFLTLTYFKKFKAEFLKCFPYSLVINSNLDAKNDRDEDIAQICTLYITNPYLLKLISIDHFGFFKQYFISPIECTKRKYLSLYNKLPQNLKEKINVFCK